MQTAMKFEPKIEGITLLKLIELDGDRGPFYIKNAGGTPDLENGFFYGDDRYQFCFYASISDSKETGKVRIVIFDASIQRLGRGGKFMVAKEDVEYLEKNIRKLFETRFFFDLEKTVSDPYCQVQFTWGISK